MAQQTAVEWLVKEFNLEAYEATVRLAKQKEREQIEQAFGAGNSTVYDWDDSSKKRYYTETYGK